jgi:hypothetical protein
MARREPHAIEIAVVGEDKTEGVMMRAELGYIAGLVTDPMEGKGREGIPRPPSSSSGKMREQLRAT